MLGIAAGGSFHQSSTGNLGLWMRDQVLKSYEYLCQNVETFSPMYYAWHSCRRQFSPKINRKSWSLNERPSAQNLWIPMPKCWNILTDSFWVVHQNLPKFQKLNFDENISEKLITYELWVQQHQFLEIFNKMSKREGRQHLYSVFESFEDNAAWE